jgi:hypothetical protein
LEATPFHHLLVDNFLIGPLIMVLLVALALRHHAFWPGLEFGLVMGLFMGISFAVLLSFAAGMMAALGGTAVFALILGSQNILTIDLLWQPRLGLALGLCAFVGISVLIDPQPAPGGFSRLRRLGSILVGIVGQRGRAGIGGWCGRICGYLLAARSARRYLHRFSYLARLQLAYWPLPAASAVRVGERAAWRRLTVVIVVILTAVFFGM